MTSSDTDLGTPTSTDDETPSGTVLEGVRAKVFFDRYSLKDQHGQAIETTPEQMWRRVARGIATIEPTDAARAHWEERFYEAMRDFKFVPGGRILAGAGSGHAVTFYNCYVTPSPEDSRSGILDNLKVMTEIMARGGGVGINLSTLRPRGSYIKTVNGTASGPCSWAELYSVATGDVIQQGGCFGPDQRIATDQGLLRADELADRIERGEPIHALTHEGPRRITYAFRNGTKPLLRVVSARGFSVEVTAEHKMGVLRDGALTTAPLAELEVGDETLLLLGDGVATDYVPLAASEYRASVMSTRLNEAVRLPKRLDERLAYLLGYFYGDGYVHWGRKVTWEAPKAIKLATANRHPAIHDRLIEWGRDLFGIEPVVELRGDEACASVAFYSRLLVEWLRENGLLKAHSDAVRVPEAIFRSPASVVGAFIAGYFDADGYDRGKKGGYGFDSISLAMLQDVQQLLAANGILSHLVSTDRSTEGWQPIHRLVVTGAEFKERMSAFISLSLKNLGVAGYRSHGNRYPRAVWAELGIPGRYYQGVWDSTKPHLSHYALSRIQDRLVQSGQTALAERVGQLLRVIPDRIVQIQPLGVSQTYDFEVEQVHMLSGNGFYTSNSRRGALMLMLDDDHPDIEEFITAKRIDPLTNRPVAIEHANVSVAVSNAFMEAVKADAEWQLQFPTRAQVRMHPELASSVTLGRKVRAREVWDLICQSAWATAEPGVVFMDRYNERSNTWYYENIRCVNPCVTGDTLVSTETGYVPARQLEPGMRIRTPKGLKPIEKVYNNGVQRIYHVTFSDGGDLDCTADHKLKVVRGKKYEWVAVSDLRQGDKVLVMPNEAFGQRRELPKEARDYIVQRDLNLAPYYDRTLGLIVGAVLGDGALRRLPNRNSFANQCRVAFGTNEDAWLQRFTALMEQLNIHTHLTVNAKQLVLNNGTTVTHATTTLECYKLATLLVKIGMEPNVKSPAKVIAENFLTLDKEFLAGLLDGLFSTDGSVLVKQDNPLLRFHTSSPELARQVRLLLLRFGIHARIYRASRAEDLEYDGRSMYGTGEKYDVVVMNEGIARFYAEIGLSNPDKAARLKEVAENWHFLGGTWTASVVSVEDIGREEEVFDVYEPETLTWVTNGYVSLDCGEQGLPEWGVCNLGALNVAAFVHGPLGQGTLDWDALAEQAKVAMRFLDNVIDANLYFIEENRQAQLGTRRTGLGTMGLADAFIKMGIAYGSEESLAVGERIYRTIRDAAYEMSADIAAEKGAFPFFDRDKYLQGQFIQELPATIQAKIAEQGIRNAVLLTQAPTGTTSLLAGVSSGIEPVFSFAMKRVDRTGEHVMYHPLLQAWKDAHPGEPTPDYFVATPNLTPEEHVLVQAMVQRYTDSSISKTVNAPNAHTVDDVKRLYIAAYDQGCKGVTYYRDGSRDAVLTHLEEKQEEPAKETPAQAPSLTPVIRPRPAVLHGYTRNIKAPEGTVNITVNSDEDGPLEVFVNVGRAGSDVAALAEALGRLISLTLRVPSPISQDERLREVVSQLRGIGGSRSVGFGPEQVRSLPDAVGKALGEHLDGHPTLQPNPLQLPLTAREELAATSASNGNGMPGHDLGDPLANGYKMTGNLCPECGSSTLVYQEGCKKCFSCGHSEC